MNRARGVLPIEAAVHRITGELASRYGLRDRGVVRTGAHADLVVFDADRIAPTEGRWRDDLPGGCGRMYSEAVGIEWVIVNGVVVVRNGQLTGAQPGQVLRSGVDTDTVPVTARQ